MHPAWSVHPPARRCGVTAGSWCRLVGGVDLLGLPVLTCCAFGARRPPGGQCSGLLRRQRLSRQEVSLGQLNSVYMVSEKRGTLDSGSFMMKRELAE